MKNARLCRHIAVSLLVAVPLGGFLFGLLNPGDPDPNPVGRVVYAFMMAVLTPLHAGFPPSSRAGAGPSLNAWPYIAIAWSQVLGWRVYRDLKRAKMAERSGM